MPRTPFDASKIAFFFGAGASAPFGIPTMKQMVTDFEKELARNGSEKETRIYNEIKTTLERNLLGESVDLEAVFTVIDGLINYGVERLSLLSLYVSAVSFGRLLTSVPPQKDTVLTCKGLKTKFQDFVREKCLPSETAYSRIPTVYGDFFNRLWKESEMIRSDVFRKCAGYSYCNTWTIFTTNYDTCLEHYWRQVAQVSLNTGFSVHEATRTWVLNPSLLSDFPEEGLRLIKLHGSISWQIDPNDTVTEEQTIMGRHLVGRRFVGEMMLYPIQQKELYLEPYISMLKELNRELQEKSIWIVVGYSFNDPVVREIFIRNSNDNKKIILLHPSAQKIREEKLSNMKFGEIYWLNMKFGEDDFRSADCSIIEKLKPNPKFSKDEVF